jgi:hypothetical protein
MTGEKVFASTKPITLSWVITSNNTASTTHTVFFELFAMILVELDACRRPLFKTETSGKR